MCRLPLRVLACVPATIIEIEEDTALTDGTPFKGRFQSLEACMKMIEIYPYCLGGKIIRQALEGHTVSLRIKMVVKM